MAGQLPSFVTGANAKIKAGGLTFAYAQDVSYVVRVDTVPVETMGRYETVSNEPVNYTVSGDLAIVRYTAVAKNNGLPKVKAGGNGLGNANWATGGNGADQFNPGALLASRIWDLAVFQKIQASPTATPASQEPAVWTITDCRFTSKGAGLNKRGILVDRMSFVGILASDDSFTATGSGDEDMSVA